MLLSLLKKHAHDAPLDAAFIVDGHEVTWRALEKQVERFRLQLEAFSSKRIMLYVNGNSASDIAMMLACSALNVESVLLSSFHSRERAEELLNEFDADCLISGADGNIEVVAEHTPNNDRLAIDGSYVCLLTSGTTGKPKCVKYNWDRLAKAVTSHTKFHGRRWFMSYQITNFAGTQVFLQCFINRGCMVLPRNWPPDSAGHLTIISECKIQYLNCTATYARKLLISKSGKSYDGLKTITLGGEVVDQVLINSLKAIFKNARVNHIYASTELGSNIEVRDEKEGFPLDLIDERKLKIVDGELYVKKSDRSMIGYLKHAVTNIGFTTQVDEEWFPTGDLVEKRDERVLFLGRRDSMINIGGFKVNPTTVESVIRKISGVKEVVATGQKNPVTGQILKVTLVLEPDMQQEQIKKEIIALCKTELPYYSVPRVFEFKDVVALTPSFKLQR